MHNYGSFQETARQTAKVEGAGEQPHKGALQTPVHQGCTLVNAREHKKTLWSEHV